MRSARVLLLPVLALSLAGLVLFARLGPSAAAGAPPTDNLPAPATKADLAADRGDVTVSTWRETGTGSGGKSHPRR